MMTITLVPILYFLENDNDNVIKLALGKVVPVIHDVIYNVHVEDNVPRNV
jgi:hypothetical protein